MTACAVLTTTCSLFAALTVMTAYAVLATACSLFAALTLVAARGLWEVSRGF